MAECIYVFRPTVSCTTKAHHGKRQTAQQEPALPPRPTAHAIVRDASSFRSFPPRVRVQRAAARGWGRRARRTPRGRRERWSRTEERRGEAALAGAGQAASACAPFELALHARPLHPREPTPPAAVSSSNFGGRCCLPAVALSGQVGRKPMAG